MVNLALIGIGAWGRNYVSTLKYFKGVRIKYLCSKTIKTLHSFQGDYIKTTNYKDLLIYKDIDGVIVATPNATHYEISQEFIKRGFNLLIEKPFVNNYDQALKLKSLQQKNGSRILVGHNYLFDPPYLKTKELVKALGKIRYIYYDGSNNGPYRNGTSALWDIGPHAISLCLDIYQKDPAQISAWALDTLKPEKGFYDVSFIKLKFIDDTQAFIKISWLFPLKKRELVIVGRKDAIIYDAVADKRIVYYKDMIALQKQGKTKIVYPSYDSTKSLEMEIKEFVKIIKNKKYKTSSEMELGVKVTRILQLAEHSIRENGKPLIIS